MHPIATGVHAPRRRHLRARRQRAAGRACFVDYANSRLSTTKIKFTRELETNDKLNLLDFTIHKTEAKFELSVFRKSTHSNRYVSLYSCVARGVTTNIMLNMRARALRYCNAEEALMRELRLLS